MHTHTHTHTYIHTHAHTSVVTIQNLIYAQLKTGSKQKFETDENSSTEGKAWRVYRFGKVQLSFKHSLDVPYPHIGLGHLPLKLLQYRLGHLPLKLLQYKLGHLPLKLLDID